MPEPRLYEPWVFCNSAYLTDLQKVARASDAALLAALGRPEALEIVERLAEGPARAGELLEALGLDSKKSGSLTRWLDELGRVYVVAQQPHGNNRDPYFLVRSDRTEELLDVAARLAAELSAARVEGAEAQATTDAERVQERERRRLARADRHRLASGVRGRCLAHLCLVAASRLGNARPSAHDPHQP